MKTLILAFARISLFSRDITLSAPATRFGNNIAASFLTGIVLAGLSLRKQEVASSLGTPMQPPFGVHITDGHVKKSVRAVLVNGSDGLGQTASALVTDRKVKSYE